MVEKKQKTDQYTAEFIRGQAAVLHVLRIHDKRLSA